MRNFITVLGTTLIAPQASRSVLLNAAAWSDTGKVTFLRNQENRGSGAVMANSFELPGRPAFETDCFRLDDLGLQNVSFIKIDVEGAEYTCLRGASELISEQHPVLFLETMEHAQRAYGNTLADMYDWLTSKGYILTHYPLGTSIPHDVLCIHPN